MHSLCDQTYGIALRLQDIAAVETLGETFDAVCRMKWVHRPNTHTVRLKDIATLMFHEAQAINDMKD